MATTATAINSSSSSGISKVICCTTCGIALQDQNSAPIAKAVPEPVEKSDGLPPSTIPTDSSSTTATTTVPSKDSESELQQQQQQQSNANSTKPKEYLFGLSDFDPKFMVDPIKFSTAVTYFLPRGTTPEIQDAIACYQLPFCPECIDTIDRICTIENEIDNLYQLMESLISFFKFRVQLAFNGDNGIQSQPSPLDPPQAPQENEGQAEAVTTQTSTSSAVDDCILKMRASIIGLKTWNGVDLNPVRPSPSPKLQPSKMVKFRIPAKSNKAAASNKYKQQKQKQPSKIRTTTVISPQLMNKKRQYRESVIKKIRTSGIGEGDGDGDGDALLVPGEDDDEDINAEEGMNVNVKVKGSNMSKRRTTTMHYDYLAISSDSNSSVDLNTPRPAPAQATGDESVDKEGNPNPEDPDNPEGGEGVDIKFAIRKSSRLESCPPKRRKNMKYSGEEYETNLSDIVSEDEMELQEGEEGEVLGEEEESEDKDWDENDEMEFEYVEGEGGEEEEDDYMDDDDDDDEVESGSDGELGFPHIVDDVEGDGDNENEDHDFDHLDLNDKVVRYKKFRELKLKREELIKSVKAKKPKRYIQKKSAVTDVGGGTFEYKNFKIIKMEDEDKFQCGTCNKIFKARANVIAHINLKHLEQNQEQRVGGAPGAGGVNRNKLARPPKRKTDRRQRQVTQLGPGVFQFEGLTFSLREDGRYQCGTCPNTLKTRDSALVHIKQRHLGEGLGKFLCFQCGKSFDRDVYLKLHEVSHSANKKLHQCSTCGKTFTQISNLYNHRKIHTGELNHHCTFENCAKKFLTRKQLTVHMKRHLGDRPYECDLCPKKFVRSSELVIHMRSHSEERPYECRLCESKFFIKYRLNRHLKKVHHIDEPVIIVERGGDAPIRIISSTSLQPNAGGTATGAGHIPGAAGPSTHVPVNMALDPQNPLHHFLSLTDLF